MPPRRRVERAERPNPVGNANRQPPAFPDYVALAEAEANRAVRRFRNPFNDNIFTEPEFTIYIASLRNAQDEILNLGNNPVRVNEITEAANNLRKVCYYYKVANRILNDLVSNAGRRRYLGYENLRQRHINMAENLSASERMELRNRSGDLFRATRRQQNNNHGIEDDEDEDEDEDEWDDEDEDDWDDEGEDEDEQNQPNQPMAQAIPVDQIPYVNNIQQDCNGETVSPFSLEDLQPGNTVLVDGKCYDKNDIVNYFNSFLRPNGTFARPFISPFTRQPFSEHDIAIIRAVKASLTQGGNKRRHRTRKHKSTKHRTRKHKSNKHRTRKHK